MEFSRPSLPGSPSTRASGRPITLDSGRAIAGASMATPTKMPTAPTPTSAMAGLASPMASMTAPTRARAVPQANRRRDEASPPDWRSSSAATGGMRTALRAGPTAATTVTPTPTASPTKTVRGSNTSDPVGSVIPNPRRSASSPSAASTPRPRPIAEETSPTMAASASTERNTWRRLAPTIRSRASSRVRCPTMIENVLKMVNPPTNREMNAKTRRAVEKNESAWLTELVCSFTTVWPVTTSTPGGRALAMSRWTAGLLAPGAATTLMSSRCPTSWRTACAVGSVNAARDAPARLFADPNWAMPVMVNVRGGPANRMRTRCPTVNPYFCAVPASITTSSAVIGGPPATRCRLEIC